MIHFVSLASGSSGNCYYLSDGHTTILIDAGIGSRTIKKRLKELDLDFQNIQAVLVTHDHVDHIKAVGSLGEKSGIPIYSTRKVHSGISRSYCMTERLKTSAHFIEKEEPFMIGSLRITAFDVPHDSTDNAGISLRQQKAISVWLPMLGICPKALLLIYVMRIISFLKQTMMRQCSVWDLIRLI